MSPWTKGERRYFRDFRDWAERRRCCVDHAFGELEKNSEKIRKGIKSKSKNT